MNPKALTDIIGPPHKDEASKQYEDSKKLFIDLKHRKAFCIRSFDGFFERRTFPNDLKVYSDFVDDPRRYRTIPRDFTPITIELNSERLDNELQVATELLKELRECNHPSGTFFRSLGSCIDQNYFWEVSMEDIEWRTKTNTELLKRSCGIYTIDERSYPLKGSIKRHASGYQRILDL